MKPARDLKSTRHCDNCPKKRTATVVRFDRLGWTATRCGKCVAKLKKKAMVLR
jgi:hypothetical protein